MSIKILKSGLSFTLALAMLQTPLAFADGNACSSVIEKLEEGTNDEDPACPKNQEAIAIKIGSANSAQANAKQLGQDCSAAKANDELYATRCEDARENCLQSCTTPEEKKRCEVFGDRASTARSSANTNASCASDAGKTADNSSSNAQPQSSGGAGSGSGGGSMMPMLAVGALAGLAGYMLGKKMAEKKDEDKDDDSAKLPNGQYDCSKKDAYKFSACDGNLELSCRANLESETCVNFAARFCGAPAPQSGPAPAVLPLDSAAQSGAGIGSPFCKLVMATNYCKPGGREACPSCLQIAKDKSPACQQNPALCLAQNSPEQIAQAKNSCPTDPMFADPKYAGGGGGQVPSQIGSGLPVVILPQSVGAASQAQIKTQSAAVAGGGGYVNRAVASQRPASDIEARYGQSVFSVSSQTIAKHCEARRYKTCP